MANFGDILTSLALGAGEAVRRNAGDTAFEAYSAMSQPELDARYLKLDASNDPLTGELDLAVGLAFSGATTVNVIAVPDNIASALELVDAGGIEYLRLNTTNAQPVIHFNEAGADVDFLIEAVSIANALHLQGSSGWLGIHCVPTALVDIVQDTTTAIGLNVYRDQAAANTTDKLVQFWNNNAGDDQMCVVIQQDAPAAALYVGMAGAAEAGFFSRDVATGVQPVVSIIQDSTTGATPVLQLQQDDDSEGVINFEASARGVIAENVNSTESVRVELNGTVYRLALYADA